MISWRHGWRTVRTNFSTMHKKDYQVRTEIKDYQVVTAIGMGNLLIEIKQLIADGWQPLGGVSTTISNATPSEKYSATIIYSQALVKY